jgi:hypothetical protein
MQTRQPYSYVQGSPLNARDPSGMCGLLDAERNIGSLGLHECITTGACDPTVVEGAAWVSVCNVHVAFSTFGAPDTQIGDEQLVAICVGSGSNCTYYSTFARQLLEWGIPLLGPDGISLVAGDSCSSDQPTRLNYTVVSAPPAVQSSGNSTPSSDDWHADEPVNPRYNDIGRRMLEEARLESEVP